MINQYYSIDGADDDNLIHYEDMMSLYGIDQLAIQDKLRDLAINEVFIYEDHHIQRVK